MECPSCKALGHTCKKCVTFLRDQVKNLRQALDFNQEGWKESNRKLERQIKINEAAFALLRVLGE